jgi:stage II sporulation protein D
VSKAELTTFLQSKGYQIGPIVDVYVHKYTPVGNTYGVTVVDKSGNKILLEKETMRVRLSPYVKSQHFDILAGEVIPVGINAEVTSEPLYKMYAIRSGGEVTNLPASGCDVYVMTANGKEKISQPSTAKSSTVTFSGKGWGNNIGMSQWSARGMAENGYTYDQILTHFFVGTTLTTLIDK